MDQKIRIYTAMRMTGRTGSELNREAELLVRVLENHGYIALNPVIEEKVPDSQEIVRVTDQVTLERYWKRDKEMIRDADLVLDYNSCNRSDGVGKELAYARYCLWKPTIRVFPGGQCAISKLEDDAVVESIYDALRVIEERFGSYAKLKEWRENMLNNHESKWLKEYVKMNKRYGVFQRAVC